MQGFTLLPKNTENRMYIHGSMEWKRRAGSGKGMVQKRNGATGRRERPEAVQ